MPRLRDFPGPARTSFTPTWTATSAITRREHCRFDAVFRASVPLDGASGKFEWDGFIPFAELPSVFNPPSGIIATANQNPFPLNYPYTVDGNFAPPYRARQIRDLLTARQGWRAADMIAVQKDVYSGFEKFLAGQIVAAYDKRQAHDPDMEDAIALLRKWDGQMDKDSAAPLMADLLFHYVRTAAAERASPGNGARTTSRSRPR